MKFIPKNHENDLTKSPKIHSSLIFYGVRADSPQNYKFNSRIRELENRF